MSDLVRYFMDAIVGIGMLDFTRNTVINVSEFSHKVAPSLQGQIGTYGVEAIEYGFPVIAAISGLAVTAVSVAAVNEYYKEKKS